MRITSKDRILIVAPHPDDETLGCGGVLINYGAQCDILLLTDGRKGYLSTDLVDEEELIQKREKEIRFVAKSVNVQNLMMLHIPDGSVKAYRNWIKKVNLSPYTMVFVPNRKERHRDHCMVTSIVIHMIRQQHLNIRLYEYEVWSPLAEPTDYLDISAVIQEKKKLVSYYKTQLKYVDYWRMVSCLNGYRGVSQKVEFAEAYFFVPILGLLRQGYSLLPHSLRKAIHKFWQK